MSEKLRVLGLDLSLTSPGFAVIEVRNRRPYLVTATHFKTASTTAKVLRFEEIEAYAMLFIREQKPFDVIVRETWPPARNYENNDKIHGAWSAVDRALSRYGYEVGVHLSPSTVKKLVAGKGNADKNEVEASVRKYLRLPDSYSFTTNDESDSCAVALSWLISKDLIEVV